MIIDLHSHIGTGQRYLGKTSSGGVDDLLKTMDRTGIDLCAITQLTRDMVSDNDAVYHASKTYPQKLVPFAHIDPGIFCSKKEAALEEIDRTLGRLSFRGVKLHPEFDYYPVFDRVIYDLLERIKKYNVPILIHTGGGFSGPLQVAYVVRDFPEIPVLLGHSGMNAMAHCAIPAAKLAENVCLETSIVAMLSFIEDAVEEIGAQRIVWGTDFPYGSPPVELRKIQELRISEEQRAMILGENATRLLHLNTRP
jgi:predicted TIM-barrel fold metal-dependent hydrolase